MIRNTDNFLTFKFDNGSIHSNIKIYVPRQCKIAVVFGRRQKQQLHVNHSLKILATFGLRKQLGMIFVLTIYKS